MSKTHKDYIVIGGGISGLLVARELMLAGASVLVLERGRIGQEASWAGGGILSPLYPWRYPDEVTELARYSQAHYRELCEILFQETGIDPEWTQNGFLMPGLDATEREEAYRWAARFGYRLESLSPAEVAALAPALAPVEGETLWMPDVAQLRNPRLLKALRAAVTQAGVEIREMTEVTGIEQQAGRVSGILCGEEHIPARKVVVCSGAWSGKILAGIGKALPIHPVKGQMLLFRATPGLLGQIVLSDGHYLIPRRDGHILAGSTLEHTGFDKATTEEAKALLLSHAYRILPQLKNVELERQWAGLRPGTDDDIPFIGPVSEVDGLYVNAGQYRNGVVMGLASARKLAQSVTEHG